MKRWSLFVGLGGLSLAGLGDTCNRVAVFFNSSVMPVKAIECIKDSTAATDSTHACMTAATHIKFLCDYLRIGNAVYSPGDILIGLGEILAVIFLPIATYYLLRDR